MTVVGFGGLLMWCVAGMVGLVSGIWGIEPQAALRFLLAILVLVFARRTYWEIREWRWKRVPTDDRLGFTNPLHEHVVDDGPEWDD
jgi:hypothetical protein